LQRAVHAEVVGIGQVGQALGLIANLKAGTDEKFVLGAFGIGQVKQMIGVDQEENVIAVRFVKKRSIRSLQGFLLRVLHCRSNPTQ